MIRGIAIASVLLLAAGCEKIFGGSKKTVPSYDPTRKTYKSDPDGMIKSAKMDAMITTESKFGSATTYWWDKDYVFIYPKDKDVHSIDSARVGRVDLDYTCAVISGCSRNVPIANLVDGALECVSPSDIARARLERGDLVLD